MKTNIILSLLFSVATLACFSCSEDEADNAVPSTGTETVLAEGEWEVASYQTSTPRVIQTPVVDVEEDVEDLRDLPNYTFTFRPKRLIIITAYSSTDPVGLWNVGENGETENLSMEFTYKPLTGLTGNWEILEMTEDTVRLKLVTLYGTDVILFKKKAVEAGPISS